MSVRRRVNLKKVRKTLSYLIKQLASIIGRSVDTILRWIEEGLPTVDNRRPYLIDGEVFIWWYKTRASQKRHKCGKHEMYCVKCRCSAEPLPGSVKLNQQAKPRPIASGLCATCQTTMNRIIGRADLNFWSEMASALTQAPITLMEDSRHNVNADLKPLRKPVQASFDF